MREEEYFMFNDPDDKPFEMTSQEPTDIGDNTPIILDSAETIPIIEQPTTGPKSDRTLWLVIGGITVIACIVVFVLIFQFLHNGPLVGTPFAAPTYEVPTRVSTLSSQDMTATQHAWIKPTQSPTLGTGEEAQQADASGNIRTLQNRASIKPFQPDINMPGDIYIYELNISADLSNLWHYGWCAVDRNTLLDNITQMKVEFVLNETVVQDENIAVQDYERADNEGSCRSFSILVKYWPEGQHQLETRVTFLESTNDGWNLYPAGMHIFKYFAYVDY